ncbi:ATP-binding cassette domain-containing protein [Sediminibacterium sp.]|uniref:ATP-binding cassette domain-containing protein n=1 Tax=Sediminibacterium sp. TaxID=1917865 RepID=UPI0025E6C304|nr:ATP-binding cassette domain-containing protein [Sediminibacterium sp.]MBW0177859.1 ATP-binding cassette domain-containing protein [Sediminibacterium sp.]
MIHTLEADGIQLEFGGRKILSSVYLKCETGKITGLLGRNGQGKTCLMNIIYGSLDAEKSVRFDNVPQKFAFRRRDLLLYLPQFNFIPKGFSLKRVFRDFELDYSVFEQLFSEFTSKYTTAIGSLSGGERRLVELYIILKSRSQFVMLDEPFTHLNPIQIEKAKELMLEEKKHKGLLITDHMYQHIIDVSDNLYVLSNGKTHLTKSIDEVERLGYAGFNA